MRGRAHDAQPAKLHIRNAFLGPDRPPAPAARLGPLTFRAAAVARAACIAVGRGAALALIRGRAAARRGAGAATNALSTLAALAALALRIGSATAEVAMGNGGESDPSGKRGQRHAAEQA